MTDRCGPCGAEARQDAQDVGELPVASPVRRVEDHVCDVPAGGSRVAGFHFALEGTPGLLDFVGY